MTKVTAKYPDGTKFKNEQYGEQYVIVDATYNRQIHDIEYTFQQFRQKFNMFKVPEMVVVENVQTNKYEVIEQ